MNLDEEKPLEEIIKNLMEISSPTSSDLSHEKARAAYKHHLNRIPSNSEIIRVLKREERRKLLALLRRKPARTISGEIGRAHV